MLDILSLTYNQYSGEKWVFNFLDTLYLCVSAIRTFKNGKSPGTDGLPAEFYKIFWNDVIDLVIDSYQYTFDLNEMSISQR
jgi:hypothetical protein